uniref:15-cis-phytoene synthase n=1 Tax=Proteomonas sulcata TaxID=77928 RepID=A0A2D2AGZ6_9CRYP|nr:phytoene synthetase [Proteomonas sulcata]
MIDSKEFLRALFGDKATDDADKLLREAKQDVVAMAYEDCKKLTSDYAKTFFLATLAMQEQQAKATWAIYAWCRRVDEIVDGPTADPDPKKQEAELEEWMSRLQRMYDTQQLQGLDAYDIAFSDMLDQYPGSEIEPYRDMIRGMQMDIDDDVRYQTWEDLYLYCYRVAATVGLMTLPIMGTAPGVTIEESKEPAIALGIALQLTNILRDVGEDARDRARIYLPLEDLEKFGVTQEYIFDMCKNGGEVTENYKNLMKFEIARAREYYKQAEGGIALLSSGAQLPVAVAGELYKEILEELENNDYDNFSKRAFVSKQKKLAAIPGLWFRTVTGGWKSVAQDSKSMSTEKDKISTT